MTVAIIDLGTNTFNLSICTISGLSYEILYSGKQAPKMGKGGIQHNTITSEAIERSIQALQELHAIITSYQCDKIIAIGTSALRNASNAQEFCDMVYAQFGFTITIISGLQEAEYIYWGNRLAYNWGNKTALILDIGGGSNEIILATNSEILWKHSFENGMQRIVSNVTPTYPFSHTHISKIEAYLESTFNILYKIANEYHIDLLIGSSGPFDTFKSILAPHIPKSNANCPLQRSDLEQLHKTLISSTLEEITAIPGMDPARIEMLPIASSITIHICKQLDITTIVQSEYSLKEGVIYTLLQQSND